MERLRPTAVLTCLSLVLALGAQPLLILSAQAAVTECSDGVDNDGDRFLDYPEDPNCSDLLDDSESPNNTGLFISVSDGLSDVQAGGAVTYVITLSTDRLEPRTADLRFLLSPYANTINASDGGDVGNKEVTWRNLTVYRNQPRKLTVTVNVDPAAPEGALMVAEARVREQHTADTTRITRNGLQIQVPRVFLSVDDGRATAKPTDILEYQITVDNRNGPDRTYDLLTTVNPFLSVETASDNAAIDNRSIEWRAQQIRAGDVRHYSVVASIERDVPEHYVLNFTVTTRDAIATDHTSIETFPAPRDLQLSVSDNADQARIGDVLTYTVRLENPSDNLITSATVQAMLPRTSEFVSATEGGIWTGKNVQWKGITVSPHGSRTLTYVARVRSDAQLGTPMQTSVTVLGAIAVDTTLVGAKFIGGKASVQKPALLRKTASRSEVQPGDNVSYTITLKNTTDHAFTDVIVEDTLDLSAVRLNDARNALVSGDKMLWNIRQLNPGEQWQTTYTVQVLPGLRQGTIINNVARVQGKGLESISLNERVAVMSTGVVKHMPATGVDLVTLVAGSMASLTGIAGTLQRRRKMLFA